MDANLEGYRLLRESCGLYTHQLALVEVTGSDRKEWLQGQATNDLRSLEPGRKVAFCFCEPTGQIIAVCDLLDLGDRYLLSCDRAALSAVLNRFESMVILEDVQARQLDVSAVSVEGPAANKHLSELMHLPSLDGGLTRLGETEIWAIRQNRTGLGGWDLWAVDSQALADRFQAVGEEAFNVARLEAGEPIFGQDIGPRVMPPELGPKFESKHVSYNKGCYTGQEVLMRIHSRGHTNRTWVGLVCTSPVQVGEVISAEGRGDAGLVTSAAISPEFGPIAAGFLRNEFTGQGTVVSIAGAEAEVRQMPLLLSD